MTSRRTLLAALPITALLLTPVHAQDQTRYPGARYVLGGPVQDIAWAELNGDGLPDLVALTTVLGNSNAAVRLNLGAGGFGALANTGTGQGGLNDFVAADLFGTPDDELAIVDFTTGVLAVLPCDGVGGFGSTLSLSMGATAWGVAAGDLDGDGLRDLVTTSALVGGGITRRINRSDGAWSAPATVAVTGSVADVVCADLDGDGCADVLADQGNGLAVLLGSPSGTLGGPQLVALGLLPEGLAAADLDGDGRPDAVAVDYQTKTASPLRNDGAGNLMPLPGVALAASAWDVVLADVDGDGALDLLTPGIDVHRGTGFGTFGPGTLLDGAANNLALAAADIDADGDADLLAAGTDFAVVLRGDGLQGPRTAPAALVDGSSASVCVAAGDFDGDGHVDFVLGDEVDHRLSLLRHDGAGGCVPVTLATFPVSVNDVLAADVDDDGQLDAVAAAGFGLQGSVGVAFGDGAGGTSGAVSLAPDQAWLAVRAGDLDGDGDTDLAAAGLHGVRAFLNNGTHFLGAGSASGPEQMERLALGDLDEDGDLDAVARSLAKLVYVLPGNGAGGFLAATDFTQTLPANPAAVELADMNEDGHLDAVLALSSAVGVQPGDGHGRLGVLTQTPTPDLAGARDLVVADIDGDGHLDAALAGSGLAVVQGLGTAALGSTSTFSVNGGPYGLAAGDWNADGLPDLVTANHVSQGRDVQLFVQGDAHFGAFTRLASGLPGSAGLPLLSGSGVLLSGQTVTLALDAAGPLAPVTLVIGVAELSAPFKGGLLVPTPDVILPGFLSGATGELDLALHWPAGLPSGLRLVLQEWIVDPAGPKGFAATAGLAIDVP